MGKIGVEVGKGEELEEVEDAVEILEEVLELVPVVVRLTDVELETRVAADDMALVELTAAEVEAKFPKVSGAEFAALGLI